MVKYTFKDDEPEIVHGRGYVYNLNYHIVWCTKYQNQALQGTVVVNSLKNKILSICKENGYTVKALEIMPNHVHILISAPPTVSVTVMVKKLKGITAKWLFATFPDLMREKFWGGHIWSPSYYAGSIGVTTGAVVKKYIETQWDRSFQ
ncbi:IS200/IS605 family transposase [Lactobacillus sp.]|uniref:IS200/IS605 family transposase n=1 Tax=Lactobacillus sp. TaxID=1591 RepID=UPI003EF57C0A